MFLLKFIDQLIKIGLKGKDCNTCLNLRSNRIKLKVCSKKIDTILTNMKFFINSN